VAIDSNRKEFVVYITVCLLPDVVDSRCLMLTELAVPHYAVAAKHQKGMISNESLCCVCEVLSVVVIE